MKIVTKETVGLLVALKMGGFLQRRWFRMEHTRGGGGGRCYRLF